RVSRDQHREAGIHAGHEHHDRREGAPVDRFPRAAEAPRGAVPSELEKGTMASIRWKVKQKKKPKFSPRKYNRRSICGRRRGHYRKFKVCRLCIRMLAIKVEIT